MSFPKICFKCSRPHIHSAEQEVEIDGGKAVVHKDCMSVKEVVELPVKVTEVVGEGVGLEAKQVGEKVISLWEHIANKMKGQVS